MKKEYLEPIVRIFNMRTCLEICVSANAAINEAIFDEDLDIL